MQHFLRWMACLALVGVGAFGPAQAQLPGLTPPPDVSPEASVSQTVGFTEITVDYHRPSARERQIWGGVVPYGQVWRAGANENTTITFSTPVNVQGRDLEAGTYGLHAIPTESDWTFIFSNNNWSWGSFFYDEAEDALRIQVTPRQASFLETLQYSFPTVTENATELVLHWGALQLGIPVEVDVDAQVLNRYRRELENLAGFNPTAFAQAATYALQRNIAHEEAMGWIDRAIRQQPTFANQGIKAALLIQAGQTAEGDALIATALPQATEADVNTLGYGLMNAGMIDRAIMLFEHNVETHPESWNVYDSLGEALTNKGDRASAITQYEKALSMAPEQQRPRIEGVLGTLRAAQ